MLLADVVEDAVEEEPHAASPTLRHQFVEGRAASVRVTSACTDIPMFSSLKKFEPIPIPLARRTTPAQNGDPP